MVLKRANAYDNASKKNARDFLCANANYHLKELQHVKMLELLGEGIGVNHYSDNIKNIRKIHAIETSKVLVDKFNTQNNNQIVSVFNKSLVNFLDSNNNNVYDIINLDFCGFYYEGKYKSKTHPSSLTNLSHVFSQKNFNIGSLIFVTFLLDGFHIDLNKDYNDKILRNDIEVCNSIINIARSNGITIRLIGEAYAGMPVTFVYKPSRRTTMMHAGFLIEQM